jgi:hypothetical protein
MGLCEACKGITLRGLQKAAESPYYEHLDLDDLRTFAKTCELCDLLLTVLRKEYDVERRLSIDAQSFKEKRQSLTPQYSFPTQVRLSLNKIPRNPLSERNSLSPEPQDCLYIALGSLVVANLNVLSISGKRLSRQNVLLARFSSKANRFGY